MKSFVYRVVLCAVAAMGVSFAVAMPPASISYQGRLVDGTNLVNGTVSLQLHLYNASVGGALLYTDFNAAVPVVDGLYSAAIGDDTTFGDLHTALTNASVWLEVEVNGTPLSPRERLLSVPYARHAYGFLLTTNQNVIINGISTNRIGSPGRFNAIAGGANNEIRGGNFYSFVGGGKDNSIRSNAFASTILGGTGHFILEGVEGGFIGGGSGHQLGANNASVPGGVRNYIFGNLGSIGGGYENVIDPLAFASTVGGGYINSVQFGSQSGFIGGGQYNRIGTNTFLGTISGGYFNSMFYENNFSTIGGGWANLMFSNATVSTIGGGFLNIVGNNSIYATIGGGYTNVIGSGTTNAVIAGGANNAIGNSTRHGVISGGFSNKVAGGLFGPVISGGVRNENNATYGTIGGGLLNTITGSSSFHGTIAGGNQNRIESIAPNATIGGGQFNITRGPASVIGGGEYNLANTSAFHSVIGGGYSNVVQANAQYSTIAGGQMNRIGNDALASAIVGGENNAIANNASFSFAGGRRARVNHGGSFVWAGEPDTDFGTSIPNSFLVRATFAGFGRTNRITSSEYLGLHAPVTTGFGGMYISTAGTATQPFYGYAVSNVVSGYHYVDGNDAYKWKLHLGGLTRMTVTTSGEVIAQTFTPTSDREAKENIRPVAPEDILDKVMALPISTWNFKDAPDSTHIGPMAQDFRALFEVGSTDKGIATVDADGVALAAIQALKRENETIRNENEALKQRLAEIEKHLGLQ